MTTDDHDASRPTAGQDHRASDQPDATYRPDGTDATGTNSAEERLRRSPRSFPPRQAGRGRHANDAERSRLPFPLSLGGDDPAGEMVEALHQLGTPNRADHERLVGTTNEERHCGVGMFVRIGDDGRPHTWPDFCQRHTHEVATCLDYWADGWCERVELAFDDCPSLQMIVAESSSAASIHRSILRQPADPRLFRWTVRLGGVVVILTNAHVRPSTKGLLAIGVTDGKNARSIASAAINLFHLDGGDHTGSKRGSASRPVTTSDDFPEALATRRRKPHKFKTADEGERFRSRWESLITETRLQHPDLPDDFRRWERDYPELVAQIESEALAVALATVTHLSE